MKVFLRFLAFSLLACRAVFATENCSPNGIRMGFAERDISPRRELALGGYGTYYLFPALERQNSEGVHDPILASAVYMQKSAGLSVALVSLDLIGMSARFVARLRQDLAAQFPDLQLILTATHSHQGPDVLGLWGAIPFSGRDTAYLERLRQDILQAVTEARSRAVCARLSWSKASKENSWHGKLPKDSRLEDISTLWAESEGDGTLLGTLTQWSAHPTILGKDNNTVSADYPGAFRYFLDQKAKGIHVYLNGMLGATYIPLKEEDKRPDPFRGAKDPDCALAYQQIAFHGHDLAEKVWAAGKNKQALAVTAVRMDTERLRLPLDNKLFRLAEFLGMIEERGLKTGTMQSEISWLRLGPFEILTFPGEVFPGALSEVLDLRPKDQPLMIVGIGNDWLGYLLKGEENRDPNFAYHRKLSPHADAAAEIVEGWRRLLSRNSDQVKVPRQKLP